jgi:TamB, inner membrane protein subunit of TAM complex
MVVLKRRRLLRALALAVLGALVIVGALPVWFPWVLRPMAKQLGASYARYERVGYQRFRLTGLSFTNRAGRFEAKQVEAFLPTVWLWRCFIGPQSAPFLQADSWDWEASFARPRKRGSVSHAYQIFQEAGNKIAVLKEWLPKAKMMHGILHLNGQTLQIQQAVWTDGTLSAQLASPRFKKTFHLLLAVQSPAPPKVRLNLDSTNLKFNSRFIITAAGRQLDVRGTALWLSNRITLKASLPEHGFLPATARLQADSFNLPARLLKLRHYQDLTGSLNATWRTNRFKLNLMAKALPRSVNWPPVHIEIRASGDTNSAEIDSARISLPWVDTELSRQTRFRFEPPYLTQPTTLDVTADLAKQPWFPAKGKLAGEAVLRPGTARLPKISFAVGGTGLSISNITAGVLQLNGNVVWPLTNSLTLDVKGLQVPHISPSRLEASWQGRGMDLREIRLGLIAGQSSLRMQGSAQLGGNKKTLDVTALELSRSNRTELKLRQPFEATFDRHAPGSSNSWSLALQPVQLSGGHGGLQLAATAAWPETGSFQISAHDLNSRLIQDFLQGSTPEVGLKHLNFAGAWTNSPIVFHLDSLAQWKANDKHAFEVSAEANGGARGVSIQRLSLSTETQTLCRAEGSLPISLEPTGTNGFLQIDQGGPLRLLATTQTNSIPWHEIADATGLLLIEPRLKVNVDGTWGAPHGQISLHAQRIQFPSSKRPLPTLEKIDLSAKVNPGELRISQFHLLLQGQPVEFTAQLPLQKRFWSILMSQRRLPDWRNATAHLKIANAQLAPFAHLMPETLSPQGVVRADLVLRPGGVLDGKLAVTNAATLPLATLGSVRDVQFAVAFTGHTACLTNFSAAIGGETVTADGRMSLNAQTWKGDRLPPFVIHLHGTNVPLVRKSSLLLRADLALALTNPASGPGVIAGDVTLRNSLFLANLQSLIPENAAAPTQHPPYFNVSARPWAAWRLDLHAHGDQFLRVQTPLFHGKVSVTMNLRGTLGDPLALGEIKIASGMVTFPFGALNVDQGFISLTRDNPYHPRLFIAAQAQQFGYNLKLEVTGTADAPIVQFSSTPSLSSQQIVLMLSTGELPLGTGVSNSARQRAQGLALFFGKNLLSEFGLGLENQNRLTFHVGQQISEAGRPTYEANYKISKRWSIVGEYDRFDQYDLNLKWNIYSK